MAKLDNTPLPYLQHDIFLFYSSVHHFVKYIHITLCLHAMLLEYTSRSGVILLVDDDGCCRQIHDIYTAYCHFQGLV